MGIKIKQDYGNIEESLLGGLKESLVKKGQQEIEAAFNELLKKPIKINGKNLKVDVTGLSESVYKQLLDAFSNGKSFSPKVRGFDLSNIVKLDKKALLKKIAELSSFIQNAPMDVSEKELATKGRHFVSSYLVSKSKGIDVSKYDQIYNDIISETEAQEQAVRKIEEQLLAYSISNSSILEELSNKLAGKLGKNNKARNIEILGKIYDADSQLDEISSEMDKLISNMKNIVFHAGNLDKRTLKSKDYSPADNLKFNVQRGRFDSQGSGTFFASNFIDVLDWYNRRTGEGKNLRLYADDLSKYSNNMFKLSSDEMSEDYSAFLERLSNFVMFVATSDDKYKKKLQNEGVLSVEELYLAGEDYFTNFHVTVDQLNEWIKSEAEYIKSFSSIDEMGKSHSINTRFQQKFLGVNGIDATNTVLDDSVARGSIVFEIDKNNPYTIDFGNNTDIAEMFYDKLMERIIASKSKYALSEDDVRDIVDAYIPDDLRGSAIHEQLEEKMVADYKKSKTHYVDDYEALNKFVDSDNGQLDSKTTEQILEQNDALDENIQKQKQLVAEKEKETEAQEELNNATKEQNDLLSNVDVPIEKMEQYQDAAENIVETLSDIEKTEDKISVKSETPIVPDNTVEKINKAEEEIDEFGQKIQGIKEFAQNYDLFDFKDFDEETLYKLQSTLFSLNSEDLKKLGFENTDEILEDLALINERLDEVRWQFENNDFTDEGWVASDELDDYFDSSTKLTVGYDRVKEVADSARMSIQNLINIVSDYNGEQSLSIIDADTEDLEYLEQATEKENELISAEDKNIRVIEETKQVENEAHNSFLNQVREAIKAAKTESETIEKVGETSNEVADTQIDDYNRIKQAIKETQEEIDHLNSQDIGRSKLPAYIEDVYNEKASKYGAMSDEEFSDKIYEKSKETLETTTKKFRVQMTSILAMIDEAKKRGQSLRFEDLISGSPEELKVAKDYFEKIVSHISSLNDESFVDDVPQKLAEATQKLRDLNIELKNVAENSNDLNFFDYKLNKLIEDLSSKKKGISQDDADRLIQLTSTLSTLSGKSISISDYTDNEKIITGVSKRLEKLKLAQERATQAAEEAALAEKQQTESNRQTTASVEEQTVAIVKNTEVKESNNSTKTTGATTIPNSVKTGFKDEEGVVKSTVDSESSILDSLREKILEVRVAIEEKTKEFKDEESVVGSVVNSEKNDLSQLIYKLSEVKGVTSELAEYFWKLKGVNFNNKVKVEGLSSILNSLKDDKLETKLTKIYIDLDDFAKAVNSIKINSAFLDQINNILAKGEELKNLAKVLKSSESKIKETEEKTSNKQSEKELEKLKKTQEKFLTIRDKLIDVINNKDYTNNNNFADKLKELDYSLRNIDINNINELESGIKEIKNLLESSDAKSAKVGLITKLTQMQKEIAKAMSNTKMGKKLRSEYQLLNNAIDEMLNGKKHFNGSDVSRLRQELEKLNAQMIATGQTGSSFWDRVGKQITTFNTKIIAQYFSIQDLIRYTRQAFETIRQLDTALIDLRKTTSMTTEELNDFYYSSSDIAKQTGVTTEEIISQAAAWSRLGYSSKEAATEMAALSSQFAQISPGMSVETATDGLVSSMKAFGFEVDEVERNVMDNINRIGNTMATTNEEIVQMLERSSAAMSAANNTIEETIALESAAVQVTRNAETTGTAFRTISMRIRGYDEETEEVLEDYEELKGKIADLTKTAKTPGGISLFTDKDKTTFKSTYQLLKDISEIWDELTDKEQAQLTEKLAGKRGGQVLSAIMNDFSEVERAMTEMSNAAGSSDKEMEIVRESIDYKINAIKQSWVGFLQDVLKREDIGKLFDSLLKGSESLQDTLIKVTPILTVIIEKIADLLDVIAKLNNGSGGLLTFATAIGAFLKMRSLTNLAKGLLFGEASKEAGNLTGKIIQLTGVFNKFKKTAGESGKSIFEVAKSMSSASDSATILSKAYSGLKSFATLGAAVAAAYSIYKFVTVQSEINKVVNRASDIYKENIESLDDYKKRISELQNILNDNSSTLEDQIDARKQILGLQKDMIDKFGSEAGQVDVLTESVKDLNEEFDKLKEKEFKEFLLVSNDDSWHNWFDSWDDFMHNVNKLFRDAKNWTGPFTEPIDNRSQTQTIRDQVEHQYFNDDGTELTKKEFEMLGYTTNNLNSLSKTKLGDFNAFDYYDDLLNLIDKYQKKPQNKEVEKALKWFQDEANRIRILLYDEEKGIAEAYNYLFEHNEIYDNYKNEIEQIDNARKELEEALNKDDDFIVEEKASEINSIINDIFENADSNTKHWIKNFVSDIQTYLSKNEFEVQLKAKDGWLDKTIDNINNVINNSADIYGLFNQEDLITLAEEKIPQKDEIDPKDLVSYANQYGAEVVDVVQQIQEISSRYDIPVELVVKNIDVPSFAVKRLQDKLGQNIELFSDDDLRLLAEEIPGSMSMNIKEMQWALENFKKEAEKQSMSKSGMIDQLNELSSGFDKLDEIYADIYDKGSFDFAKLGTKKFQEAFGELNLSYEDFMETISGHTDDIEYCQQAFNNLVDEYIKANGVLDNVTEANAEVTESMLEMYGVTNANELVQNALINTEAKAIVSKYDLANATDADIQKLLEEIGAADGVKASLIAAQAAEVLFSNTSLNADQKVGELQKIASAAWGAAAALEFTNLTTNNGYDHSFSLSTEEAWAVVEKKYSKMANAFIAPIYGGGKSTQDAIDKANKSGEESKKIFDWIEKALQRQEEEISRIDKVVNATYKDWSKRNSSLLSEINEINKEIAMQETAYQAYLRDAEAIPLSEEYKKLVREGAMKSEIITDKTLQKNIDEYEELYDKAIKAKDAVADLESKIASLAKAKFDNVKSEFEGFTSEIEHFVNMIDKELSHVENMGKIAGKTFYTAKIESDNQKLNDLNAERASLLQELRDAEANGIEQGSADWVAMRNDIYSVDEAIAELTYNIEDLKKKLKEVAKLNFDDLKSQFENAIGIINNQKSLTDSVISMVQNAGYIASREYYKALIEGSKTTVTGLRKEYETLSKTLAEALNTGDIEKYDEQWYQMQNDISSVRNELVDAANATIEYANALRQIDWDVFDRGLDAIGKLNDETEFFIELLSYEKLFDKDTAEWTTAGITTRGLMVQEYQAYMDMANAYGAEAEEIRKLLETDPKNTVLIDRYQELLAAQREAILNAQKEKKSLEDLIKNGYDELLKRIKKLIDELKDALDAQKDLYDYSNTISDKTKKISDLQKQIAAYSGDAGSEETRATLQKLNAELSEAQRDLEETEYDKYISDQKDLLDDFYTDLEDYLDGKFDETATLFEEAVAATNLNGKLIDQALHDTSDSVNYRMTDEFTNIWDKYADEGGIAAGTLNILTLTNDTTSSIRIKMDELPTEASLEAFFNGDDLRLLQELTSVRNNTANMINAINTTNEGINRISSNIVEYSGMIANKIDGMCNSIKNAIDSKNLSVSVNTGSNSGGSGNGSNAGGTATPATKSNPNTKTSNSTTDFNSYKVTGYDEKGYAVNIDFKKDYYSAQEYYNLLRKKGGSVKIIPYAKGGIIGSESNFLDSIAKLLGEDHMVAAKEGERILTEEQNKNFEKMVNANFTPLDAQLKDKYSMLSGKNGMSISGIMANIPTPNIGNVANVGNTTTVGDINITLPNITNKDEFVAWLKTDGQVEKIIQSMTIGRMAGGNSYAKMKY